MQREIPYRKTRTSTRRIRCTTLGAITSTGHITHNANGSIMIRIIVHTRSLAHTHTQTGQSEYESKQSCVCVCVRLMVVEENTIFRHTCDFTNDEYEYEYEIHIPMHNPSNSTRQHQQSLFYIIQPFEHRTVWKTTSARHPYRAATWDRRRRCRRRCRCKEPERMRTNVYVQHSLYDTI